MRRKRFLIIGLQVVALTGFILMALGSASSTPAVQKQAINRLDRGSCGNPEYVFMGERNSQSACTQACNNAGFSSSCLTGSNCFCK